MHPTASIPIHFSVHKNNETLITPKLKTEQMEGYSDIFCTEGKTKLFANNNFETLLEAFTAPMGFLLAFSPACVHTSKEEKSRGVGMHRNSNNNHTDLEPTQRFSRCTSHESEADLRSALRLPETLCGESSPTVSKG